MPPRGNRRTEEPGDLPDRLPPHSIDAEQAVLGAALISRSALDQALALLRRDDFYLEAHRKVFDALAYLTEQDAVADTLTLPEELRRRDQLDAIGGQAYVFTLAEAVPTAKDVRHYIDIVAEKARLRGLREVSQKLVARIYEEEPSGELIATAFAELERFEARALASAGPSTTDMTDLLTEVLPPPKWAVPGLLLEGLNLLVSAPKIGKSWLAYQIGLAVALGGTALGAVAVEQGQVLALMLEDTKRRAQSRAKQLLQGLETFPRGQMEVATSWPRMDQGGRRKLERWLDAHPQARLVIIDTLEIFRSGRSENGNVYGEDVRALREIKAVADHYQVCFLVIHHDSKPKASDFVSKVSGSRGITGSADSVLFLERTRQEGAATLEITGRDVEEAKFALEFSRLSAWTLKGDAEQYGQNREQEQVLKVLRTTGRPMRFGELVSELADAAGVDKDTAKMRVSRMKKRGQILCEGSLYYLPTAENDAAPVTPVTSVPAVTSVTRLPLPEGGSGVGNTVTPGTGVTEVTGVTPPSLLPDPLPLPDETPEVEIELRRRAYNLGWSHRWRRLQLDANHAIEAGEEAWRHACSVWFIGYLERAIGLLGGAA